MEKAGLLIFLCLTPLFNCLPTRSDSSTNSDSDSAESFGLGSFFKGYRLEEAIDTALTKVEQHDMEIEELRREISQIGDILEKQSFLLGKIQDLMQIEEEDPGYQDDQGSEQVNSRKVESAENPPPVGTQNPPQFLQQSIRQTQDTLEETEESVSDLESALQERLTETESAESETGEENTSESPEDVLSNEIPTK